MSHGRCSDLDILIYGYCKKFEYNHCTAKHTFVEIGVLKKRKFTCKSIPFLTEVGVN